MTLTLLRILKIASFLGFLLNPAFTHASEWLHLSTDNFRFIYQKQHQSLLPRIIVGAEVSLHSLKKIFHYQPTEIITIIIRDYKDIGSGKATALPHNTVTLDVAPFDQSDYDSTRFDDQFQWLFSHELVHIVIGDQASPTQARLRRIFGKVMPIKNSPLTLPFSLLTNRGRFTPTWYQEGIAVFMETWLNGGYGRVLSSYDEMYFRTLSYENAPWLTWGNVDFNDDSFLLGSTAYLYGTRFMSHLTIEYGLQGLLQWVRLDPKQGHIHFHTKFQQVFGTSLENAWALFLSKEKQFQQQNLKRIQKYPLSATKKITTPLGWVTRGYQNSDNSILLASLRPHHLTAIEQLDLNTGELKQIHTLATPSLIQVASTAFDKQKGTFFFTTHNEGGYRDLWAVNIQTRKSKRLFKDARIGNLAINPQNHALWGIQIRQSQSALVMSSFPYQKISPLILLPVGTILGHLQIHPNGKSMLATLRRGSGEPEIILIDLVKLLKEKKFLYSTITNEGSPEHPSWGLNGKSIYWNAYTSGVSNIFRKQVGNNEVQVLSNTPTGLFHPLVLDKERIFAYQFTSQGFQPVIIPNQPVDGVAAIHYRGQQIIEKHPELREWRLKPDPKIIADKKLVGEKYHGWLNLQKTALIPTIASYGKQTTLGLYGEMKDPLGEHRLYLKTGISEKENTDSGYDFHLDGGYEYLNRFRIGLQHLPTSFYDLANQRDIRRVNNGIFTTYNKLWIYDRPKTLTQWFYLGWNQWKYDDFGKESSEETLSYGTGFQGINQRSTIGSVDAEKGYEWNAQLRKTHLIDDFATNATTLSGEFNWFTPIFTPHNIFRVQTAAGKSWDDFIGAGLFYFEGFGDQLLEERTNRRYRQIENFFGLGNNSQIADSFAKFTVENIFPSIKIGKRFGDSYLKRADVSIFHQRLYSEFKDTSAQYYNLGFQSNWHLTNFYTIDATLSLGFARAWDQVGDSYDEFFLYIKLFRN
jgi:hypothetical protein